MVKCNVECGRYQSSAGVFTDYSQSVCACFNRRSRYMPLGFRFGWNLEVLAMYPINRVVLPWAAIG